MIITQTVEEAATAAMEELIALATQHERWYRGLVKRNAPRVHVKPLRDALVIMPVRIALTIRLASVVVRRSIPDENTRKVRKGRSLRLRLATEALELCIQEIWKQTDGRLSEVDQIAYNRLKRQYDQVRAMADTLFGEP